MYTYFNRFLHHTLSCPDAKPQSTPMLSYSGLTRISRWNKFADWFDLDTPIKSECDSMRTNAATCRGRSMVEMLGVLAIIGVLSVGAIAGYSKAMMKYKLNQHAVAVNMLINNVLSIKDKLEHSGNNSTYYNQLLYKMNLLPDGIIYQRDTNEPAKELNDIWFKNKIGVVWSKSEWTVPDGTQGKDNVGVISFNFNPSAEGYEVCRNIVIAAKENAANIDALKTFKTSGNTTSIQGDKNCSKYSTCLRDITLETITTLCNNCKDTDSVCTLAIFWK